MLRTLLVTALAIAAVADFASHAVSARERTADVGRVKLDYTDLDLTAPRDAKVMATRIDDAARDICGGDDMTYADLTQRRLARTCIQRTSAQAASMLKAPLVTTMVTGKSNFVLASR